LSTISLFSNNLTALHPKMFSHLDNLNRLDLSKNPCIDKDFWPVPSMTTVEEQLTTCGAEYELHDQQNSGNTKFEETDQTISGKLEAIEKSIGGRFENFEKRFEEMQKNYTSSKCFV
jgi:hypothetical protein